MPGRYLPLNDGQSHTLDSFWYAIVPAIEEDYIIVIVEALDDGAWRDNIGRPRHCAVAIREDVGVNDAFTRWFAPMTMPAAFKRSSSSSATAKKQPAKKRKVVEIQTPVQVPPTAESSSASSSDSEPKERVSESLLTKLLNKN